MINSIERDCGRSQKKIASLLGEFLSTGSILIEVGGIHIRGETEVINASSVKWKR